ncbi:MAG: LPS export ABC transporter periplasmic protein LptC [bacterium]
MRCRYYIALTAIFILLPFLAASSYAEEETPPIAVSADYLEYIKQTNMVIGKGNVRIEHLDMIITSDHVIANLDTDEIEVSGNVTLEDKGGQMKGTRGVYNIKTKKGTLENTFSFSEPWYVKGKTVDRISEKQMVLNRGRFSTCDKDHEHYSFRAKKINIYPGDKIVAKNVFLYIDNVPIFYFPIFWQSLKGTKYDLDIRVGSNSTEGDFVKVRFGYPLTSQLYGRLYLDYMSKKGWGKGAEFKYKAENVNSSIYGYHIREEDTQKERWSGQFTHWQKLNPNLTLVSDLNFLSDENFNDRYNAGNTTRITRDLRSYMALTYSRPLYVARIVGERRDIWETDSFVKEYEYLPRFSFDTTSIKLNKNRKLPLYYKGSLKLDNYSAREPNDFYRFSADADQGISSSLRLSRFLTLIPSVGFQEQWQNKRSKEDPSSFNRHIYRTGMYVRNTINRFSYITYGYNFKEEIGKVPMTNSLSGAWNFNFPRFITTVDKDGKTKKKRTNLANIRVSSTYDMRHNITVDDWAQRFSNLVTNTLFTPYDWQKTDIDHHYNIYTKRTEKLQTTFIFTRPSWNSRLTGTYLDSQRSTIDTSASVGFWLTSKWKVDFTNRASVYYKHDEFKNSHWSERTYTIYRDLHCWEALFYWTKRPSEEELWFKINIKALPKNKLIMYHNVEDEEWHLGHGQ